MRNRAPSIGRLLRSVALRYRQPGLSSVGRLLSENRSIDRRRNKPDRLAAAGDNLRDERMSQLEAVLFLSPQPVGSRKLAQLADLADGTKARTLVRKLNRRYDAEGRAFRVEEVAGGFQFFARAKFAPWLRRLYSAEVRLSPPAMETLAVVAYRQPVLRADIEAIRGVQSGEVLRQLIERDMVRIVGRSDELGRPFLYGTGRRFLQVFGLRHLDELPQIELIQGVSQPVRADLRLQRESTTDVGPAESNPAFPIGAAPDLNKTTNPYPVAEEETNVKTFTTKARPEFVAEEPTAALMEPKRRPSAAPRGPFNQVEEEDDDFEDDDEDLDDEELDDLDDDDEEEEEEDEEELEDEWEEVEDDEEDEEDDEDEDEDWDDEDWDDDDWDDDEDEDEEEEEEGGDE
jgi:segregation and condensation protein B